MLSKYLTQVGLLGSKCLIKSHQLRILGAHHVNGLFKIQPQNFSTTSQIQMSTDAKQEPKKKLRRPCEFYATNFNRICHAVDDKD